jgi:hypothetical protein
VLEQTRVIDQLSALNVSFIFWLELRSCRPNASVSAVAVDDCTSRRRLQAVVGGRLQARLDAERFSSLPGANGTCAAMGEQLAYSWRQRGGDIITQSPEAFPPHFQKAALDEQYEEGG